jgi:hypothetical protein
MMKVRAPASVRATSYKLLGIFGTSESKQRQGNSVRLMPVYDENGEIVGLYMLWSAKATDGITGGILVVLLSTSDLPCLYVFTKTFREY